MPQYPTSKEAHTKMFDSFDVTKNPDARKHWSLAQSNQTVMLLPLKSGRIAVFGRDFQLHAILDQTPSFNELVDLSTELALRLHKSKGKGTVSFNYQHTNLDVESDIEI